MPHYSAPLRDMRFAYAELFGPAEEDSETVAAVLAAAAEFAARVLQPLNLPGDIAGCSFDNGVLHAPPGFKQAHRRYVDSGWPGLAASPAHGGQGCSTRVATLVEEMLYSANLAFTGYVGLTHAAYRVLDRNGTAQQKALYLPKLAQGTWSATMCLTEPQAGSDLGLIRMRADPRGDGTYALTGSKIFVSGGEHDLTENIVHLVLARLPDGPPGTHGLSLFVAPKYLPTPDADIGPVNAVRCTGIEHKMGTKGAPTCALDFDAATAWLVGEPHRGLIAMFAMMNTARLAVATQGLGLAEVAYQNALAYAKQRRQGHASTKPVAAQPADPIILHPDVRRNLLTMRALTQGLRALTLWLALNLDRASGAPSAEQRQRADDLVQLLTPIAKSFGADVGCDVTNIGVQIFGGHGYIRDNGMEQFVRDARVTQLYEGTTGIQALDLVGRKLRAHGGRYGRELRREIDEFLEAHSANTRMAEYLQPLRSALDDTREAIEFVTSGETLSDEARAVATDVLRLLAYVCVGYMWTRTAAVALTRDQASSDEFHAEKLKTARFYMKNILPRTAALTRIVLAGGASVVGLGDES